jgi:hypothetical protein
MLTLMSSEQWVRAPTWRNSVAHPGVHRRRVGSRFNKNLALSAVKARQILGTPSSQMIAFTGPTGSHVPQSTRLPA